MRRKKKLLTEEKYKFLKRLLEAWRDLISPRQIKYLWWLAIQLGIKNEQELVRFLHKIGLTDVKSVRTMTRGQAMEAIERLREAVQLEKEWGEILRKEVLPVSQDVPVGQKFFVGVEKLY